MGSMRETTGTEDILRDEVDRLRSELEAIKKVHADPHPVESLSESVEHLNKSINVLIEVFERAEKIVKNDDTAGKLSTLMSQNKQIANGIIAVADLVKQGTYAPEESSGSEYAEDAAVIEEEIPFDEGPIDEQAMEALPPPEDFAGQPPPRVPVPMPESPIQPLNDLKEDVPIPPPKKGFFTRFSR